MGVGVGLGGGGSMSTDAIVTDATCNNQLHNTGRVEYSRMTNKRGQFTSADGYCTFDFEWIPSSVK